MITLFSYLLKMTICSGILFLYYRLALRNKVFNQYNRFYLLGSVVLSVFLPLCKFSLSNASGNTSEFVSLLTTLNGNSSDQLDAVVIYNNTIGLNDIVLYIVAIVGLLLLAKFVFGLLQLHLIAKQSDSITVEGATVIQTNDNRAPFSFFDHIFWRMDTNLHSEDGQRIFLHELAHVKEKHSYDKVFMSIVLCVFWFNPFFWLMKYELYLIHEFIADKKAVKGGDEMTALAAMLLATYQPGQQFSITNNFFHSPIKRRLAMMTKNQKQKLTYASRLFALPLLVILVTAIAIEACETKPQMSPDAVTAESIDSSSSSNQLFRVNGMIVDKRIAYAINKNEIQKTDFLTNITKLKELGFGSYTALVDITLKEVSEGTRLEQQDGAVVEVFRAGDTENKYEQNNTQSEETSDDNIVFTKVEHEAEFTGGLGSWRRFLEKNVDPKVPYKKNAPAGTYTVVTRFIVSKNGKVSDVIAESKHGYGMEAAAISAIKNSPDWNPATTNGIAVNAYRRQPITFVVPNK